MARKTKKTVKSKRVAKAPSRTRQSEESAAETAYQLIKHKIMSRAYAPGEFMHEFAICKDLGMGRTPVHQALHRLKLEKYVTIIPRKGVMVDAVTPTDIFIVLEVRELIEPYCAAQASFRGGADLFAQLQNVIKSAAQAMLEKDLVRFMELDQEFHGLILSATGNELLIDFSKSLHGRVARIWRVPTWSQKDFELTYAQHKAVVEAIGRKDSHAASEAMRIHIQSLRERVLQQFIEPVHLSQPVSAVV